MQTKSLPVKLDTKSIDQAGMFEGYASVFGTLDSHGHVIVKGAFEESLARLKERGKMPKLLFQHNAQIIIGKIVDIFEDDKGLFMKARLFLDVPKGNEAYILAREGELDGLSVGINIVGETSLDDNNNQVITKADLWEVSMVTWGSNPEATVTSVKSINTERDFEKFLRDSGFSRSLATAITSKGFKAATTQDDQRDAELKSLLDAVGNLTENIRSAL